MQTWQFEWVAEEKGKRAWRWVCVMRDGSAKESDMLFDSFHACKANAVDHGYIEHPSSRAGGTV